MSKDDPQGVPAYTPPIRPFGKSNGHRPRVERRPGADNPQIRSRGHRDQRPGANCNAGYPARVPPPVVSPDEGGDGLSVRELYAGCIYLCLTLLAGVTGGLIGVILMNIGFWIGAIDIGWVDDLFDRKDIAGSDQPEGEESQDPPEPLPDNVTPLPLRG